MEKNTVSFVRLDNANLLRMTMKELAKNFANYSQLIIDLKGIEEEKHKLENEFSEKAKSFEKGFNDFKKIIAQKEFKDIAPKEIKELKKIEKSDRIEKPKMGEELKTLLQLKREFEKIQEQLHEIKIR